MTSPSEDTKELRDELLERVRSIGPVLADGVPEGDRERRLPDDTVRAIEESRVDRLWTARRYGGLETGVRTLSEVTKALSHYCPSTSWVVNNINGSNLFASRFPLRAQDEVFCDNPGAKLASIFVAAGELVPSEGGYSLTGKWPYASGILHDDWAILSAKELDSGGETVRPVAVLVPVEALGIEDTWFTVGMRATGSHTVVAENAPVPEHRVIPAEIQLGRQHCTDLELNPLFRSPAVAAMAVICASVVLGAGQAALSCVVEKAPSRKIPPSTYASQPESPTFVSELGRTALNIDAAEMHVRRSADAIDTAAERAVSLPENELRRIRGDAAHAVKLITGALDELMWAYGASAFAEASPMQQYWRDANTAARHAMLNVQVGHELYGGSFFGLDSIVPGL
ncbi:hypothetical protein ACOQFL_03260 [Actinopolyspora sp. H202]|uniref:hypothetical protein n=1 Tax=Actinopolyspora sp. H202 TaxID=1500456 RepID=UPI003EE6A436